ncbi:MAG: flagellin [Candidatus Weimeria sp.]
MIINNNISAVIANKHLLRTEAGIAASTEKLSSGYKINHAYQNPSGMAISNKMRAQIKALDRATDNASDGISVIQTADGALNEVTSMLQRMRELAVQAANDTNTPQDRAQIQKEEAELRDEIDRVSSSTEFNTMQLLNGDMQTKVYADNVSRLSVSDSVDPGTYYIEIKTAATKGILTGNAVFNDSKAPVDATNAGTFTINGETVTLTAGMTSDEALEALKTAAELGDATVSKTSDNKISITSGIKTDDYDEVLGNAWGNDADVTITYDTDDDKAVRALSYFGLVSNDEVTDKTKRQSPFTSSQHDAEVNLNPTVTSKVSDAKTFSSSATASVDGKKVTIKDNNGFEMSFLLDDKTPTESYIGNLEIKVTDIGKMAFHVGSNKDQVIETEIPSISAKSLYLDQVNVNSHQSASRAISLVDDAITQVSSIRATLGAAQNRLEHTYDTNNSTSENINSAVSRIRDTDMATEMVEYTKDNVLQQAGTSVLSQANEIPQMALQLLQ